MTKQNILSAFFYRLRKKSNHEKTIIEDILQKRFITKKGPQYITIDITNRCNLNCIGCWTYSPLIKKTPDKDWFTQELPYDIIKKLIIDLKELKTKEIRLTGGGEPFMHPRIMDIIELIKKNGFKLDITTNFTLLTKERLEKIADSDVDNITVSLWSATPETYISTHTNQTSKTFDRLKENLIYFNSIRKNTKLVIANVISNLNFNEIEKMILSVSEIADEVYFTLIDPIKGETDSLLLNKNQQAKLKKKFEIILKRYYEGHYGKIKIDNPENLLRRISNENINCGIYDAKVLEIPCTAGWTFSRIMANGDVAPCCRGVMISSGNIKKENFKKIWNSKKQQRFRKIGLTLKEHPGFIEKVGCIKTCDNLMHNIETFDKLKNYKRSN